MDTEDLGGTANKGAVVGRSGGLIRRLSAMAECCSFGCRGFPSARQLLCADEGLRLMFQ